MNFKADFLIKQLKRSPDGIAVEIGCLRHHEEDVDDGFSTYHLCRNCVSMGKTFYSFDNEITNVNMANTVLREHGLPLVVQCQDGSRALSELSNISFLFLDSSMEESLPQFNNANLVPNAIVIVDDFNQIGEYPNGKATEIVKVLSEKQIPFTKHSMCYNDACCMLLFTLPNGKPHGTL